MGAKSMTIALVTGANGFMGSHMVDYLLEKGHGVRCVVRKTSDLTNLRGAKVEYFHCNLTRQESLREALEGVEYVFHFAGKVKARSEAEYIRVNAFSVGTVAEACLKQPTIRKLLLCSSLAAVGPQLGMEPVNEETKPHPISIYGKSKLQGEEILAKICGDKIPWCIVRPTGIYGPRDTEIFLYFKMVNKGLKILVSGGDRRVSMIYARDIARFCWLAATKSPSGETFLASDGEGYTWEQLSGYIAQALKRRTVTIKIPLWFTSMAAAVNEKWAGINGEIATLNREKARELRAKGWVCSIGKARSVLGFEPEYKAKEGIALTADWYRENGWL